MAAGEFAPGQAQTRMVKSRFPHSCKRSLMSTLINTLVTGRYRLSVYRGSPEGELYDLVEDPHELVNLWHEPLHQRVRHELVERMLQRKLDLSDPSPRASALA